MLTKNNPNKIAITTIKNQNVSLNHPILSFSKIERSGKVKNLPISSKNYTTKTNENEISTHEETLGFTRASLRSVEKHRFKGKSIRFAQSFHAINDFPKSELRSDFFKPLISFNLRSKL